MKLKPSAHIDLTGHLRSLKPSLTPDCKLFEPSPPLYQLPHRRNTPSEFILRLFILWLITTAAIIAAYIAAH